MAENKFQAQLIRKLKKRFPGCMVLKNDPSYKQGILDLTILHHHCWAMLEVKDSATAKRQPNQEFYVKTLAELSFADWIYPENEEEVLDAMEEAFASRGATRIS
jgi:hypothetical protein